jgi:hypothetical protein
MEGGVLGPSRTEHLKGGWKANEKILFGLPLTAQPSPKQQWIDDNPPTQTPRSGERAYFSPCRKTRQSFTPQRSTRPKPAFWRTRLLFTV